MTQKFTCETWKLVGLLSEESKSVYVFWSKSLYGTVKELGMIIGGKEQMKPFSIFVDASVRMNVFPLPHNFTYARFSETGNSIF